MAAVWAAGPEPMMTTLECMVREGEKERRGAGGRVVCADAGGVCGRKEVVAARVKGRLERRGGEEKRRKVEENRMMVGGDWGEYKELNVEERVIMRGRSMALYNYHWGLWLLARHVCRN